MPLPFISDRKETLRGPAVGDRELSKQVRIDTEAPAYVYCVFSSVTFDFHDDAEFFLDDTGRRRSFLLRAHLGYPDLWRSLATATQPS